VRVGRADEGKAVVSSTGRGPRLGGKDDFFVTPAWAVRRLLEDWKPPGGFWLEPGAGNGAIIRAVNDVRSDVSWLAAEIREEERPALEALTPLVSIGDFLTGPDLPPEVIEKVTVVIANPAFSIAQEVIDVSRQLCPRAELMFLLRLNYVGSEDRAEFMRRFPPDLRTLPNRPSFVPGGKTDSIEYAWMGWKPGRRERGTFRVLASTPIAQRRADR
jgi:hypothetical protein